MGRSWFGIGSRRWKEPIACMVWLILSNIRLENGLVGKEEHF